MEKYLMTTATAIKTAASRVLNDSELDTVVGGNAAIVNIREIRDSPPPPPPPASSVWLPVAW
jgi:hypothetical protein